MNLPRYVKTLTKSFDEMPLTHLDVLAFTWMTYFDMTAIEGELPKRFAEFRHSQFDKDLEKLHQSAVARMSASLARAVMDSPRYRDAILLRNVEAYGERNIQFGAIAFDVGGYIIIAFEGTDLSSTGWEEDCMMSYSDEIASYPVGLRFTQEILDSTDKPVILAGHSKGGNIAVYVAAKMKDASRIVKTYSFEGPGFHRDDLFAEHPEREALVTKYIPKGSMIGILLNSNAKSLVVRSNSVGIFQHNAMKWNIRGHDFCYVKQLGLKSRILERAVNDWLNRLTDEDKKRFVDLLFGALGEKRIRATSLVRDAVKGLPDIVGAYNKMSEEDRAFMGRVVRELRFVSPAGKKKSEPAPKLISE